MAQADPLNRRVVEQMLVGVTTRQYARSLEPIGDDLTCRGTSKSTVSRRFVVQTTAQLEKWRSRSLADLDVVALLIDGLHVGDHCLVAAMGIDATGQKHVLGLWDGATGAQAAAFPDAHAADVLALVAVPPAAPGAPLELFSA